MIWCISKLDAPGAEAEPNPRFVRFRRPCPILTPDARAVIRSGIRLSQVSWLRTSFRIRSRPDLGARLTMTLCTFPARLPTIRCSAALAGPRTRFQTAHCANIFEPFPQRTASHL